MTSTTNRTWRWECGDRILAQKSPFHKVGAQCLPIRVLGAKAITYAVGAIASKRNETHFKRFIKSRVDIEKPLQEFLTAQEQYRKALQAFSPLIQEHGEVLGLSKDDIGKLVNLKLPQIKDVDRRISVV